MNKMTPMEYLQSNNRFVDSQSFFKFMKLLEDFYLEDINYYDDDCDGEDMHLSPYKRIDVAILESAWNLMNSE